MNNTFLLFYSSRPRSQIWILLLCKLANYVLILDKLQNGMSDPSHVPDVQATYHSYGPEKSWIAPSTG